MTLAPFSGIISLIIELIYNGGKLMKVYMLQDVEKVGMAGQVIEVSDGYAINFLIPRKLAKKVGANEKVFFAKREQKVRVDTQILNSKVAMLAERIKNMHLVVKERVHDDGKLYGAVGADEIVELLKKKDININRKQVEFKKAVRSIGEHKVAIKLSSKLKPELTLKVVSLEEK
jgi:large subunit ribosomal protein L9